MKLVEIGTGIADLIISEEQSRPRSPGVHVSDVIDYLKKTLGKQAEWGEDELETSGQLGRVWERIVARTLADSHGDDTRYFRPDPVCRDGITGSPDGIDTDDGAVLEFKCAYKSARRNIELDFPYYFWQIKAYCYMTGLDIARLYVLFINGNYDGKGPIFRAWEAKFTPRELKENWAMMLAQAKDMTNGRKRHRRS